MQLLVTGAAGYIASHLVARLLDGGHRVRGTVRDPGDATAVRHLRALPGAAARLELVAADLNDPDAFRPHVGGVDAVLHTASPYRLSVRDVQRELIRPAVDGTRALLEACAAAPGVRRVVLTSSVAAVTDAPDGRVYTEADWNERSTPARNAYHLSKTLAERAAWTFVETARPAFDLVAICPYLVIGPSMTAALNPSMRILHDLAAGAYPALLRLVFGFVDVRDVALAHVRALETPDASGRYLCIAGTRTMRETVARLRAVLGDARRWPRTSLEHPFGDLLARVASYRYPAGIGSFVRTHVGREFRFDTARIRHDLRLEFRDLDRTLADAAADLLRWGHLPR